MHIFRPIVLQALTRVDEQFGATSISLAKKWSRDRLVFYVDHPYTFKDLTNEAYQEQLSIRKELWKKNIYHFQPFDDYPNFINICPSPVFPINFLPPGMIYNQLKTKNCKTIWKAIDTVLDRFHVKDNFVYINSFNPVYFSIHSKKKYIMSIYHCVDLIEGEKYIAKHGKTAEKKAAANADLVITTSDELRHKLEPFANHIETVYNGADYDFFQREHYFEPHLMKNIPKGKRVTYVGNIGLRINYKLLEKIVKNDPELQLILIGPINEREFRGGNLLDYKNVHHLGPQKMDDVPDYIYYSDVCIIPFLCNDLTQCIYPLKINEYLSVGKPVLTTPFTNLEDFDEVVHIYDDDLSFEKELKVALEDSKKKVQRRKEIAKTNKWENRASQFHNIYLDKINRNAQ
ncbi:glycosyltransferase [Flammeovirga aprica]|uniref:Glycosyltransferase family 1 protein n=1 Tax=Flammeovirga aprica JL-4 TaxID=694437 RepID=A0A7X9X9H3_9BACT|nr:glycosyltransferase [Flammeovirga aprica]NME68831.1 glycosyltransferase family 1 protein [Flammeovirga aprica JL-4]